MRSESTGDVQLDRWIFGRLQGVQIAPPLVNRQAVNGWSRLPVQFNFPERGAGT